MEGHVPEPTFTLEGWHILHDFRHLDYPAWQQASLAERRAAWEEVRALLAAWREVEAEGKGSFGVYQVVTQKADLLFLNLRPDLEALLGVEEGLNKSRFARYLRPAYGFYSVVELGSQTGPLDPEAPYVKPRLTPKVPKSGYVCFYPMNKRREGQDNWYMLPARERAALMKAHGETGRKYQGKVLQVISGAQGLDDWEWGVDLFSEDPLQFKKIVYEMRFDEVSARFGEFGPFYVGRYLSEEALARFLGVD
ncbi:MAG: heme-dependent peroxidase [Thermus sp.]|uniref:hydrogen peroxide-dependent heme synthase n=1 Tax=Thermus sp. TaxID=275 RepID=UPI0025ED0F06|nr:hydrogen peroxide-dependent heme synthase [Thermus sp.]MCS6869072.1 heme-dependent peroxidase [Thermus sp.]MCS7217796.1 heme-dependent peroxidase [Thermus sp.]MDW8016614.1 hydrogen peroxide-dependent heme synthase [Thermus sp.]MDW8356513.1 hydrogen peroxide-dependent heme synthase [Thermus sp.]